MFYLFLPKDNIFAGILKFSINPLGKQS